MERPKKVIRAVTWRTAVAVVFASVLGVISAIVCWRKASWENLELTVALGLVALVSAVSVGFGIWALLGRTDLVLTEAGFHMTGVGRIPVIPWSAVDEFVLFDRKFSAGHGVNGKVSGLGFRLKPDAKVDFGWKRHIYAAEVDGEIALNLSTTITETHQILEAWRSKYG